jgi:hypothetical protein
LVTSTELVSEEEVGASPQAIQTKEVAARKRKIDFIYSVKNYDYEYTL